VRWEVVYKLGEERSRKSGLQQLIERENAEDILVSRMMNIITGE